jgi:hypothetical protein
MAGFLVSNFVGPTQFAQIPLAASTAPAIRNMKISQIGMDVLTLMSVQKTYPTVI